MFLGKEQVLFHIIHPRHKHGETKKAEKETSYTLSSTVCLAECMELLGLRNEILIYCDSSPDR